MKSLFMNILSITVLSVLAGCENHDNNTENATAASVTSKTQAQANGVKRETFSPSSESVSRAATNQPSHERSQDGEPDEPIYWDGGFDFGDVTFTNTWTEEAKTNSLP